MLLMSRHTCWRHDDVFDVMTYILRIFNVQTNFLTSWRTFLYHDKLFDVMTMFLMSWRTFWCYDVFLTSWWTFWRHYVLLTSWRTFLTSWRFWCHDKRFWVMKCLYIMTHFLTSWRVFDIMTNFLTSWGIFDVMINFWCHDVFLTSWTFKCHDYFFGIMMFVWRHDELLSHKYVMTSKKFVMTSKTRYDAKKCIMTFLTSWRTFWCHEISWRAFWWHDVLFNLTLTSWRNV